MQNEKEGEGGEREREGGCGEIDLGGQDSKVDKYIVVEAYLKSGSLKTVP